MAMNIVEIIDRKSKGLSLTREEINYFVNGVVNESVSDYQSAALLMAIKINGLDDNEVIEYARALINSGDTLPLNEELVDKHSSGGVGDKTSLILLPVLGAMGLKVFKLSGRGLGFTGGTIDKLESVDGFKAELTIEELEKMVSEIGISISGQTQNLTPADGKLYALRDVTATVDSLELIAASIIAKKIASGAKNILIDLKVGTGAFVSNLEDANELARLMKLIAAEFDRNLFVLFSSMDQPLGYMSGNMVEVEESINYLQGLCAPDLRDLIKKIASELYSKVKGVPLNEAENKYKKVIKDKSAFELQKVWFAKHGVEDFEKATKLKAKNVLQIKSPASGYIKFKDVKEIGNILVEMKAGRKKKDDKLDYSAGIVFKLKTGEAVSKGDVICIVTSTQVELDNFEQKILDQIEIVDKKPKHTVILGEVSW